MALMRRVVLLPRQLRRRSMPSLVRHCSSSEETQAPEKPFGPLVTVEDNVAAMQLHWETRRRYEARMGWVLKLTGYYGEESTRIRMSQDMWSWTLCQSRRVEWESGLGLCMHEFMPANALIVLHAWIVHRRLLTLGEAGKKLQQDFFDQCWENTEDRVRKMGIMELLVSKYLRQAQEYSFGLMVSLDQAVEEGRRPLVDALLRNVYMGDADRQAECERLADYVMGEIQALHEEPDGDVVWGRFVWAHPPVERYHREGLEAVARVMKGEELPPAPEDAWRTHHTEDGRAFFFNTETLEARWEKDE